MFLYSKMLFIHKYIFASVLLVIGRNYDTSFSFFQKQQQLLASVESFSLNAYIAPYKNDNYNVIPMQLKWSMMTTMRRSLTKKSNNDQERLTTTTTETQGGTNATTATTTLTTLRRTYDFQLHSSINEISEIEWNNCISIDKSSPFLKYSFLKCLEESKCVSSKTGWIPQHIIIYEEENNVDNDDNNNKKKNNSTELSSSSLLKDNESRRRIVGVVPMYIKSHSLGEFIFDQAFAQAAYNNRIQYYPKLLVAVPFTPVTGQRINWAPQFMNDDEKNQSSTWNRAVGQFLKQMAVQNGISSVHCNFITDIEATDLGGTLNNIEEDIIMNDKNEMFDSEVNRLLNRILLRDKKKKIPKDNYLRRTSLQYHWMNENPKNNSLQFISFDDYLNSCFKSKKRITIKRERKSVIYDQNIIVNVIAGNDIMKYNNSTNKKNNNRSMTLIKRMYEIYVSTIDKMYAGRQYLTLEFFEMLCQTDFINHLVFICARKRKGSINENEQSPEQDDENNVFDPDDVFAGTINIVGNGVFYGRYWGCLPEYDIKNLHFEVCYWSAIEYCINNGYKRMEPGAGGGDYKWARGFNPALIHSAHYICHPGLRQAVNDYLIYETEDNIELTEYLRMKSGAASATPRVDTDDT